MSLLSPYNVFSHHVLYRNAGVDLKTEPDAESVFSRYVITRWVVMKISCVVIVKK